MSSLHLPVAVILAFALLEAILLALVRALDLRCPRRVAWIATVASLLFVAPDLVRNNPMCPTQVLNVPGMEPTEPSPHSSLNDTYTQLLPWEAEVRRGYRQGQLPLWSGQIAAGTPIWANPQAQALSPIAMLTRMAPLDRFFPLGLALKCAVAFRGTYLLTRILGAGRLPAALGAASFAWGGGIVAWGLWPHGSTLAWLPWLVLSAIRLARAPSRSRFAATAVVTAIVLVSGYPVMAVLGGGLAALCSLYFNRARGRHLILRPAVAAAAALLGLGLAAIHVLPFAETLATSHRSTELAQYLAQRQPAPVVPAAFWDPRAWFKQPDRAKAVLHPEAFGKPYADPGAGHGPVNLSAYSGLIAWLGAVLALLRRRRPAWPFLGSAALFLAAYAGLRPLDPWNAHFPEILFSLFFTSRFVPVMSLSVCVAAALGLSGLRARVVPWLGLAVAAGPSLAAGASPRLLLLWALLAAAISCRCRRSIHSVLLLGVLGLDLGTWSHRLVPVAPKERFFPRTAAIDRALQLAEGDRWRITGYSYEVYPNKLSIYGLADIRYHDPLETDRYRQVMALLGFHAGERFTYVSDMTDTDRALYDFLNVRGTFARIAHRVPVSERFHPFARDQASGWVLLENRLALPRFFLPSRVEPVPGARVLDHLRRLEDPSHVLLAREELEALDLIATTPRDRYLPIVPDSARGGRIRITLPEGGDRLLVTSLKGPPGWRARSEDGLLDTLTVNHAFLGVVIPTGTIRVLLDYRPPGFIPGVWLSLCSLAVLLALMLLRTRASDSGDHSVAVVAAATTASVEGAE